MINLKNLFFSILILFLLGCSQSKNEIEIIGNTMGTTYSVKYYQSQYKKKIIQKVIDDYLNDFNTYFSTYESNSEISRINQTANQPKVVGIKISKQFKKVLLNALEISKQSQGFFDPTVYPLVKLWRDFRKDNSEALLPQDTVIKKAMAQIGYRKIKIINDKIFLDSKMSLDFSAIAKGSGVDGIAHILANKGIENYFVEIGGEIRVKGFNPNGEPWKILIKQPNSSSPQTNNMVVSLTNKAIATSGDYQNFFIENGVRYSHLINPKTGKPIRHQVTSVSVIADNCEDADAWATALIVMGKDAIAFSEKKKLASLFILINDSDEVSLVANSFFKKYLLKKKL